MKKKVLVIIAIILILTIFTILIIRDIKNKTEEFIENRQELMEVLGINNSETFLPISIKRVNLGFGDMTDCYLLKFEISIEDYNKNSLKYEDTDTTEVSLNWKEKKDEKTYICYVREWEYNNYRKELFDKLKELKTEY